MSRARRLRRGTTTAWENRAFYQDIYGNADQTEWRAVCDGSAMLADGAADERMADAADQFENPDAPEEAAFQRNEATYENLAGTIAEEINWRAEILGDRYPFVIEGGSLSYRPGALPIYEALLAITQAQSLTAGRHTRLPRGFERIACVTARAYLGPHSRVKHVGWPRLASEPKRFKAVVAMLRDLTGSRTGEWLWKPSDNRPDDPMPADIKDGGIDVVAWIPQEDRRTGQLYLLGQCACGDDWNTKFDDINLTDLNEWAKISVVPPIRSFFTPFRLADTHIYEASRKAGLVFDRIRIVMALHTQHGLQQIRRTPHALRQLVEIAKRPPVAAGARQQTLQPAAVEVAH